MYHCIKTYEHDATTFFLRSSTIRCFSHTHYLSIRILKMTYAKIVEPFTVTDNINTKIESMVRTFNKKMHNMQKQLYTYEQTSNEEDKQPLRKELQKQWDEASGIIQQLREMQNSLNEQENEAIHNFKMNDGIWKHGQTLSNLDSNLAERQMRLDSARKLALQSEEQQRRQVKVKWMYVILFILLLGGTVYMYMWVVGNEVGIHNAKSYNEAIEAPSSSQSNSDESTKSTLQRLKESFMGADHHDDDHHDDDHHDDYYHDDDHHDDDHHDDDHHDDDHHDDDDFMSNFFNSEPEATKKNNAVDTSEPSPDK